MQHCRLFQSSRHASALGPRSHSWDDTGLFYKSAPDICMLDHRLVVCLIIRDCMRSSHSCRRMHHLSIPSRGRQHKCSMEMASNCRGCRWDMHIRYAGGMPPNCPATCLYSGSQMHHNASRASLCPRTIRDQLRLLVGSIGIGDHSKHAQGKECTLPLAKSLVYNHRGMYTC